MPANVSPTTLGRLISQPVDGAIDVQPPYTSHGNIVWKGAHNIVYTAEIQDSIYFFDLDGDGGFNDDHYPEQQSLYKGEVLSRVPGNCQEGQRYSFGPLCMNYGVHYHS